MSDGSERFVDLMVQQASALVNEQARSRTFYDSSLQGTIVILNSTSHADDMMKDLP